MLRNALCLDGARRYRCEMNAFGCKTNARCAVIKHNYGNLHTLLRLSLW
jgi:hypothetical protein